MTSRKSRDLHSALKVFRDKGGTMRTKEAIALGVHTDALYQLRDRGDIIELSRGLYRVADARETDNPDLALVAIRAPHAAVCLISALAYHGITTQDPAVVHLAVPRGSYHRITLDRTPVRTYRFDAKTFEAGLEVHTIGGLPVNIYSVARAIVDSFKFRNKIGLDVAIEALRLARTRKRVRNSELLHFARLLRVEKPMAPYLQAVE